MRVLIATPYLPWPLNTGGNAAQFSTLQCLAGDHEFTLVAPYSRPEEAAHVEELQQRLPAVKVRGVFCGPPPESALDKAVRRVKRLGRRILRRPLLLGDGLPYYPFKPLPAPFISTLHEELRQNRPDLVQAEFVETLPLGVWLPNKLPRLFIHHQIHAVYAQRFVSAQGTQPYSEFLSAWMTAQERMYLPHFDAVVTFSEEDRSVVSQWPGLNRVFTSPFPIPADVGVAPELPDQFGGNFIFLGSEEHDANRQALQWLLQDIWPEIYRTLPDARLEIIGRWSQAWQTLFAREGAKYFGFLPDLRGAMRGGIMLVPLRIGSGIRTKILAALAQGVPVVTTKVGAEGLLLQDNVDLLIRDEPRSFAAAAIQLAKDPTRWREMSRAGQREVLAHYSPEQVRRRRNQIYEAVCTQRSSSAEEHMSRPVAPVPQR
jgi:polysaccharide biosynthesis protein PslH